MEAYQERVVDEAGELQGRLNSLVQFIGTRKCRELGKQEADLLVEQARYMQGYLLVLQQRIAYFT